MNNMFVEFEYILAANITITVNAEVRLGKPAKIDALPEDCYEAEDAEVLELFCTHLGNDLEIDDIYIGHGFRQQALLTILNDMAIEVASND